MDGELSAMVEVYSFVCISEELQNFGAMEERVS